MIGIWLNFEEDGFLLLADFNDGNELCSADEMWLEVGLKVGLDVGEFDYIFEREKIGVSFQ